MSKAFQEITESIAHLSRKQRLDLANLLLPLNDGATDAGAADEWDRKYWQGFERWIAATPTGFLSPP